MFLFIFFSTVNALCSSVTTALEKQVVNQGQLLQY